MTIRHAVTRLGVSAAVCAILTGPAAAQDQLAAAKDLYATAAYEDALAALTRAQEGSADVAQVDQYRAFCLFALGRTAEAESLAEAMMRRDPLFTLDARDASPRIEAMFSQVRKRLLPGLIRERFRSVRASMEQGVTAATADRLVLVRRMLDSAKAVDAWDDALDDVSFLVDGFLDLTKASARKAEAETASASPAPSVQPPPAADPATPPQRVTTTTTAARAEDVATGGAPSPAVSIPPVFGALDADVKSPVPIRQVVPKVPVAIVNTMKRNNKTGGILEILIDEQGVVTDAKMRDPANPEFDAIMVEAARTWKYRPATKGGRPVPYVKRVAVNVAPTEAR